MTLTVYWGIFTCALLIPVVLGVPFCPKKWRLALTVAALILALCPLLPEGISLAQKIYSITDALSVILLVGLIQSLWGRTFVSWNLFEIVFLILAGQFLYACAQGFLPDFVYVNGFRPIQSLGAALILMGIVSDWRKRLIIAAAFGSFLLGLYVNFFDALLDPILMIVAIVGGLTKAFLWVKWKKKERIMNNE